MRLALAEAGDHRALVLVDGVEAEDHVADHEPRQEPQRDPGHPPLRVQAAQLDPEVVHGRKRAPDGEATQPPRQPTQARRQPALTPPATPPDPAAPPAAGRGARRRSPGAAPPCRRSDRPGATPAPGARSPRPPAAARQRRQQAGAHVVHRRQRRVAVERPRAGGQLDQRHAQRELIAGRGERLADQLLGRHVRVLALAQPAGAIGERGGLGDAEVGELDLAGARHQQVRRADVAVDQAQRQAAVVAGGVHVGQPQRGLLDHQQRQRQRQPPVAGQGREVAAVDVLEHDVVGAVVEAQPQHRDQVAVVQAPGDPRLVDQRALERDVADQLGQERLDRDRALEAAGALRGGQPHLGHAAAAEPAHQRIRPQGRAAHAYILSGWRPTVSRRCSARRSTGRSAGSAASWW